MEATCSVPNDDDGESVVRLDFLLENIYAHLLKGAAYEFRVLPARHEKEVATLNYWIRLLDAFTDVYRADLDRLCRELDCAESGESIPTILRGISGRLFPTGITWGRIVALFAFVGGWVVWRITRAPPPASTAAAAFEADDRVASAYESFSRAVRVNVDDWVRERGGWRGVAREPLRFPRNPEVSWWLSYVAHLVRNFKQWRVAIASPNTTI